MNKSVMLLSFVLLSSFLISFVSATTMTLAPLSGTSFIISGTNYNFFVNATGSNWAQITVNGVTSNVSLGSTTLIGGLNVTVANLYPGSGSQTYTLTSGVETKVSPNPELVNYTLKLISANQTSAQIVIGWVGAVPQNINIGSTQNFDGPNRGINVTVVSTYPNSATISVIPATQFVIGVFSFNSQGKSQTSASDSSTVKNANCSNNFYSNGSYSNETSCLVFSNGTTRCITTSGLWPYTYSNGTVTYTNTCPLQSPALVNQPLFSSDVNITVSSYIGPYGGIGINIEPDSGLTAGTSCQSSQCPPMNNVPIVWCYDNPSYSAAEILYMGNVYVVTSESRCSAYTNYPTPGSSNGNIVQRNCNLTFRGDIYHYIYQDTGNKGCPKFTKLTSVDCITYYPSNLTNLEIVNGTIADAYPGGNWPCPSVNKSVGVDDSTNSNISEIPENNATTFNWIYQNFTLYLGTPITTLIKGNNYSLELINATGDGKGVLLLNGLLAYNISNGEKTQIGGFNLSVLDVSLGGDIGIPFALVQVAELNDSSAVTLSDIGLSSTEPEYVNGVLVCASGCLYKNKCLPYGVRSGTNYCGPDGNLATQLGVGSSCLNNFECSSNACVDSQCISHTFLQVIAEWITNQLKTMFGIP